MNPRAAPVARRLLFAVALVTSAAAGANRAASTGEPRAGLMLHRQRVAAATVTIPAKSCAGALVHERTYVLTAAHCVPRAAERMEVRLKDGTSVQSSVRHIDRDADLALLVLDTPAPVEPLELANELPSPNQSVLFVGRVDRPSRAQVAQVERLGICPSLPAVDNALFTTITARPGDSGAPLVDENLRVVGVVHGGARCEIAVPTASLAALLADADSATDHGTRTDSGAVGDADTADTPSPSESVQRYRAGPFVLEMRPKGFRFSWAFRWSFGDTPPSP